MKYAVIETGGKQYKISPGDLINIEKIEGKKNNKIVFDKVLLLSQDKKVLIGQPTVERAKVKAEIVDQFKDKKIRVATYKAKARYRRTVGHRHSKTRVKILELSS